MTRLLKERKSSVNILTIFAVTTFGLHIFTLFLLIFQGLTIRQLATGKPLNFLQLIDSKPAPLADNREREPEEIRQFISKTMNMMFDWSGILPAQTIEQVTNPQTDKGISIKTSQGYIKKVSTTSWVASFALSQDFRQGFLAQIADMTPPQVFSNNASQTIAARLIIQRVYPPKQIAPGEWRVGMVANIVQFRPGDNRRTLTPFNKDFLVRAVDSFDHPLPKDITELQKAVYRVRAQRLEIYEILDLCLTDKYDSTPGNQLNRCSGSFIK
jgi:hypothetical protein